jgi:hypothetical protein
LEENFKPSPSTVAFLMQLRDLGERIGELEECMEKTGLNDVVPDLERPGIETSGQQSFERAGVTHLVHAWHQQGKQGSQV